MNTEKVDLVQEIKKNGAPESGMMYAVYQNEIKYEAYSSLREILERENPAEGLLELHLFDEHKEYRYIKKRNGFISKLISDDDSGSGEESTYEELIYTEDNKGREGRVSVVNYITFDEDDLMRIEKYRLKEVK